MGEPQTPHFHGFGTFERVRSSQNILTFGDTRTLKTNKESQTFKIRCSVFAHINILELQSSSILEKAGAEN